MTWKTKPENEKHAGATTEPEQRKREYEHNGYTGTVYYAANQRAEDRLLAVCHCKENEQCTSNAKEKPGYVYDSFKTRKAN